MPAAQPMTIPVTLAITNADGLRAVADALRDLANAVRNLLDDDAADPRPGLTEYISTLTDPVPPTRPYGIDLTGRDGHR